MPPLSREKLQSFLKRNNLIAKIATVREDGWPYVVAVWYEYDGSDFYLVARARAPWVGHIRTNDKVALYLDEVELPFTRVLVEGRASIVGGDWVKMAERMSVRYLGPDGPKYLTPTLGYPRALVKIAPQEITSWEQFDWHPRYVK